RGIANELEKDGITVLESTLCVPQIITTAGVLTRHVPSDRHWEDIRFGLHVAKEIGRLGIGQTVVVKNGMVIAVEAVEGTDEAIKRGGSLARAGCVVIKVSKPKQDLRFDVPAVGVETIKILRQAGAVALALEAGKTLLLEKEALLTEADAGGIAVVGVAA
ncbi:MAG TPA: LpxI family protein, partial [Candidatus Polarisedimenticolaceae bacterium]|nr:LpxI family protein [Candidatus Polarisedimenticolaceae bacterium]